MPTIRELLHLHQLASVASGPLVCMLHAARQGVRGTVRHAARDAVAHDAAREAVRGVHMSIRPTHPQSPSNSCKRENLRWPPFDRRTARRRAHGICHTRPDGAEDGVSLGQGGDGPA